MSERRERTSERLRTLRVDFIVILPTVGRTDGWMDMRGRKTFQEKKTNIRNKRIFSFSLPSYFYIALSHSKNMRVGVNDWMLCMKSSVDDVVNCLTTTTRTTRTTTTTTTLTTTTTSTTEGFSLSHRLFFPYRISSQKYARAIERLNLMYEIIGGQQRQLLDNNNRNKRIFSFSLPGISVSLFLSHSENMCARLNDWF